MKLPTFLDYVKLKPGEEAHMRLHMRNWLLAHAHIRTLKPDHEGIRQLELMLWMELTLMGARLHMLQRLYGRYSKLRYQLESRELFSNARKRSRT